MKISDVTPGYVAEFLKLDAAAALPMELNAIMAAARSYISHYTGLPEAVTDQSADSIDSFDDLTIAFLVLCQDMYDNRAYLEDSTGRFESNRIVDAILGMHARNLL